MKKELIIKYVEEGMDSYRILLGLVGQADSSANLLLLKWPDATKALASENFEVFEADMNELICKPIYVVGLSIIKLAEDSKIECMSAKNELTVLFHESTDPVKTKKQMIKVIDKVVAVLQSIGSEVKPIGGDAT